MKIFKTLTSITLATLITSTLMADTNTTEELSFHSGSIKDMDSKILAYEKSLPIEDIILVSRLVDVYPNKIENKKIITEAVLTYSKEYNIDPITLTAVLAKESSLRQYPNHLPVMVKIPLKKNWTKIGTKEVQAVGMGGVIFEIWKYELAEIGIKTRKSLFNIKNNIKATAKILSIYMHERRQIKGTASREESALLRYYGVQRDKKGSPKKTYSTQVYKIKSTIKS